jgi:hypothetical protein
MWKPVTRIEPPLPLMIAAFAALSLGVANMPSWRLVKAKKLYLGQCDVALANPRFSDPEGLEFDFAARSADGSRETFERYEWYVARLVYVLDECLALAPIPRWYKTAETQLAAHKHYLGSDYYRAQDYLPHYSLRMRALIAQQKAA